MTMNSQEMAVLDSKRTVELFNKAKRALVRHFCDRPFEKYDQSIESKNAYALNLIVGKRDGKYNSRKLVPDVTLEEAQAHTGCNSIIYASPVRGPEDRNFEPKWFKPSEVTISYCPAGWPGKDNKPEINVRVHNREEVEGIEKLLRKLDLKPKILDHELWTKVDIYASLCS